ncbi:Uu.00g022620.m01.CDS01 [Anthostomella pinea]|uniref:Uu.00g022620.m01.CDS01 n=1 Tax=Anthostomella pinea TaxID=933095 RepID=A0AAI8W141_9PEZI|nr:Uu.00g022620.m01.CDS01 [Anthostomella pinea]
MASNLITSFISRNATTRTTQSKPTLEAVSLTPSEPGADSREDALSKAVMKVLKARRPSDRGIEDRGYEDEV